MNTAWRTLIPVLIAGILLFVVEACSGLKTQETRAECPNHEFYLKCKALDRVETFIDVRWKVWNPHTQQWVDLGLHCKSRTSCPEKIKKANISDRVELAISNPNATLRVRHFMPDDPGWKYSCQVVTDTSKQIHTVTVDITCISSEIGADANLISGLLNIIPWDQIKDIWLYEVRNGTCTKTGFCYDELCFTAPDGDFCPSRYGNRLKARNGSFWITPTQPSDNGTQVKFRIDMKNRKVRFYLARILVKYPIVAGITSTTASTDSSVSSSTAEPPKATEKTVRTAPVAGVYAKYIPTTTTSTTATTTSTTPTAAIASASSDKPSRNVAVILWAVSSCLMLTFS